MVDKELLIRKIKLIGEDQLHLQKFAKVTLNGYRHSITDRYFLERTLERIIGRMIDINFHLVTAFQSFPPKDYYESFIKLGEIKVLNRDVADKLAPFSSLRNRLAQEYDVLDDSKVLESAKLLLKLLPLYQRAVLRYTQTKTKREKK